MCGRYTETKLLAEYERHMRFKSGEQEFHPRYNIAPTQEAPVVVNEGGGNILKLMRWGLIPPWAEDESIGNRMINARAETLAQKPTFRKPFEKRRCLVLADGFYEWQKSAGAKIPHRFILQGNEPFAFAGLWERWRRPDGTDLHSYTIITTEPNELARQVHDRMPVILAREHYEQWLDPQCTQTDRLLSLLRPYPAQAMACYPVSPLVNNPRFDDPKCIEPLPRP